MECAQSHLGLHRHTVQVSRSHRLDADRMHSRNTPKALRVGGLENAVYEGVYRMSRDTSLAAIE